MVLDECPKKTLDYDTISKAVDLSTYCWPKDQKKHLVLIKKKLYLELFKRFI